jgi:integrase/recombinase XerD
VLAHNGLRIGEALSADVEDLGSERGHRTLRITPKGGRRATVVLAPVTARALDGYLDGREAGPLFVNDGGRRLDEPGPSAWYDASPGPPGSSTPTGSAPTACAMRS